MNQPNATFMESRTPIEAARLWTTPYSESDSSFARAWRGFGLGILTGKADVTDSDPNVVNPGGVRSSTKCGGRRNRCCNVFEQS